MPLLQPFARTLTSGLLLSAACAISACKPAPAPDNVVEEANGPVPEMPSETVMDRAGLLNAVAAAASDYSAGVDDRQTQLALDGKRFEVRMPFGCGDDASTSDPNPRLTIRPDGKAYEASAAMDIGMSDVTAFLPAEPEPDAADNATVANEANPTPPAIEAAEGFWIARPWMLGAQCPAVVATDETETTPPAPHPPTVGIVQYYGANDSRVGYRGGKSLTKIEAINALKTAPAAGAVLILQGRLRHWPDGKVIACMGDGRVARPQCLASATIDHIAFQRADNGAIIAEWTR